MHIRCCRMPETATIYLTYYNWEENIRLQMIDNVNQNTYNILYKESDNMATVPTQIRIDEELKKQAVDLFAQLGLDMSSAMNMFLKQCVLRGGLPFNVELPNYKADVIEAMEEAKRISKDPNAKKYNSFSEA